MMFARYIYIYLYISLSLYICIYTYVYKKHTVIAWSVGSGQLLALSVPFAFLCMKNLYRVVGYYVRRKNKERVLRMHLH